MALDNEFTWDDALGGEAVAQRVKGLSLLSSRMDAVAEPDAALVYCEWIMEFKNVSPQQREARAQIALPPGAVVSRVTLWIDGEEREAAFGGRSQVRKAYQEVAVQQRRDPVLVTTCGPDRVLMQCFPVQPSGGVMKVKLGITAPLLLEAADRGQFVWPQFLERNFAIAASLKHDLWIESPRQLTNGKAEAAKPVSPDRPFAFRYSAHERDLFERAPSVTVHRPSDVSEVWTPASETGTAIRQWMEGRPSGFPKRLVIAVDGSEGMKQHVKEIAKAVAQLPQTTETMLLVASDRARNASAGVLGFQRESLEEIGQRLERISCEGGQDNLPVLEAAWDAAASVENGVVLWVHGIEPVLLSAESGMRQRMERNLTRTRLLEVQTETGPDRVIEKLDGLASLQRVPRMGSLSDDLVRLFGQWSGAGKIFELKRELASSQPNVPRVSRHIERLWARDEAARLAAVHKPDEAAELAAKNQLVTPLTGAVVLERKEQYDRHGLTPADPGTVPSVPEPGVLTLFGVGIVALILKRRRVRPWA